MKTKFAAILLTTLFIATSASFVSAQDADKAVIDKFISAQAKREHGEEYEEARKVVTGDLTKDGVADTVVLYTIEGQNGSNNHVQYLAVFTRASGELVVLTRTSVGSKSYRDVELDSITNDVINLTTMTYGKNDPSCCPSVKGSARYQLAGGKLAAMRQRR